MTWFLQSCSPFFFYFCNHHQREHKKLINKTIMKLMTRETYKEESRESSKESCCLERASKYVSKLARAIVNFSTGIKTTQTIKTIRICICICIQTLIHYLCNLKTRMFCHQIRRLSCFSRLLQHAESHTTLSGLPQLHPLLVRRAHLLQEEQAQLSSKLDTYDPELQITYDRNSHVLKTYDEFSRILLEIRELSTIRDPDLISEAQEELQELVPKYTSIIEELNNKLLPPVKYAECGCMIELRPGVGGNEASLFTDDLMQMYLNFASIQSWPALVISRSTNSSGFVNEIILSINQPGAYDVLRHESGVHRVQRIPETENKGRVHTSTSAVIILPKMSDGNENSLRADEMQFKPGEVRIDTMRAGGKGGQHVNTTDSAVRLVHIPTGIMVMQQDERSQPQNKAKAFAILRARLAEKERVEELNRQRQMRTSQVSSTDRSDKIRTYNYPQNRVTDHRCGFSLHDIAGCMGGNKLNEIIDKVREVEYKERLQEMLETSGAN